MRNENVRHFEQIDNVALLPLAFVDCWPMRWLAGGERERESTEGIMSQFAWPRPGITNWHPIHFGWWMVAQARYLMFHFGWKHNCFFRSPPSVSEYDKKTGDSFLCADIPPLTHFFADISSSTSTSMFGRHVRIQHCKYSLRVEIIHVANDAWKTSAHLIYLIFHQFAWEMVYGSKCCRAHGAQKTAGNVLPVLYLSTDSCSSSRNNNSMLSSLQRIGIYVARLLMWAAILSIYFHSMDIKTAIFRRAGEPKPFQIAGDKIAEYWLKSVSVSRCWID